MPIQVKKVQLKLKDGQEYKDGDLLFNVDAQAWATGKRNGVQVPVPTNPDDKSQPHKENNAAYYAEQAANYVENAQTIIGAVKDQAVAAVQAQETTSINAVQSQQTTSVNAVAAAGENAIALFPDTYSACDSLASDFAPVYVANQAYNIGDYVIYQYQLYKCNTKILENQDSTFVTAHWTTVNTGDQLQQKVNIYDKITADQLMSTTGVEDKEPYNFRTSGGAADIGDREEDMIVGGTVAWNQLIQNGNFASVSTWALTRSSYSVSGGIATVSRSGEPGSSSESFYLYQAITVIENHKYLMTGSVMNSSENVPYSIKLNRGGGFTGTIYGNKEIIEPSNGVWYQLSFVLSETITGTANYTVSPSYISGHPAAVGDSYCIKDVNLYDLTQMFGSTIADYIYSLEQNNAGDGVAWFRKLFPKDYYAYDAGTLQSVQISAHKMVGFNAFDKATGTARLLGGMQYQISGAYTALSYSTGETITPDANGKFTPNMSGTLTVTGGDGTTTCVHLVWDGERDGEYEAYTEHSYPLDDSLTLRGVPTLDANNKLRYDGDTYSSDGTVTRRYGIVDLGSLVWYSSSVEGRYTASVNGKKPGLNNFIQAKYSVGSTYAAENDKVISGNDSRSTFSIKDTSAATAEELKTSLSGVYLVYELETPTTETADSYTNPQIIDPYGTEEFIDAGVEAGTRDVAIPVGHETFYPINLREKLEKAPNNPNEDGNYIVKQENGVNNYVPVGNIDEINNLNDEINNLNDEIIKINGIYELNFIDDAYIQTVAIENVVTLTPVINTNMSYIITDCVEGQKFYLSGVPYNNSNYRPYMFVDSNNICLFRSGMSNQMIDYEIVAPENATKLIINFQKAYDKSVWVNGIKDINNRLITLNESKADNTFISNSIPDISCESFDYQQETIHHDNFHRTISGEKLWHIGNNGTSTIPMDYISGFSDYETVDDGFRIIDNKLKMDTSVARTHAMRIANVQPTNPFLVEVGFTPENIGISEYCGIAYNIIDNNNYDSICFKYQPSNSQISIVKYGYKQGVAKSTNGGIVDSLRPFTAYSIRILFCNNIAYIWYDDSFIMALEAPIITNGKIGLATVYRTYYFHWDFFNIHNLVKPRVLNSGLINDNFNTIVVNTVSGATGNNAITHVFNDENFEYLYNPSSEITYFSPRSERIELKFLPDNLAGSRRSELMFAKINQHKLRKIKLEYDLYLKDYDSDSLSECFTQILSAPNDVSEMEPEHPGYNPSVMLGTLRTKIRIRVWGQSNVNNHYHEYEELYEFGDIEPNTWKHIELFVKEGYMPGHCPLTILKIDGKTVFRSTTPNTVNTVLGGMIKYGIYKSEWYAGRVGEVTDRILYFDNVKLTI